MLAKGIVEEIISQYEIRVRIPTIHGMSNQNTGTPTSKLGKGPICTLPHCDMNLRVNDIVVVGFEDNDFNKPIILGVLYMSKGSNTLLDMNVNDLTVSGNVKLPPTTTIGKLTPDKLSKLLSIGDDVQTQLDSYKQSIDTLSSQVNELVSLLHSIDIIDAGTSTTLQL